MPSSWLRQGCLTRAPVSARGARVIGPCCTVCRSVPFALGLLLVQQAESQPLLSAAGAFGTDAAYQVAQAGPDPAASQEVYLAVELNGRDTGSLIRSVLTGGRLYARPRDLESTGLELGSLEFATDELVALDTIPGLDHRYDAQGQSLVLRASGPLLRPFVYGRPDPGPLPAATSGRGLVLNYDAYYEHEHRGRLSLWNAFRYFGPGGVIESTGVAFLDGRDEDYVRYDTFWARSDPEAMRTLRVGDTISSSLDWTRPVRMAGIQWSSNFALRPDLVTFPLPQIAGTAAVPTTVDLYINNVRRTTAQVPQGPFIFSDAPGITGAGSATIVTRDALGRAVSSTVPLYIDRRMLAQGLTAYSVEAGFLRRYYGFESSEYDSEPAASATLRHGHSDALTLEAHAEAMPGAYNLGGGALLLLKSYGVVNAGLSVSGGSGAGQRATLGYQWIRPGSAIDLQSTRSFGDYWDLGGTDGFPAPRKLDRATFSVPLGLRQSAAFSYIGFESQGSAPSRIASIAYSASLADRLSLNLSAYKDFGPQQDKGFFLSLSIALDSGTHVGAYGGSQNGESSYNLSALRRPDYEGGWGWGLQAGHLASTNWAQAQATYRGSRGEVTALARNYDGRDSVALSATGAVVFMDGRAALSRRIQDGFAMVSTGGVEGVPVLHENRTIGRTDRGGHYLVPDLNSYQRNRIAVNGLELPADMKLADNDRIVVPQARSGVLVEFPITEYRAATVILHDSLGAPLPVGARVLHRESGDRTVVGYDGVAFIENLLGDNHLEVEYERTRCTLRFSYDPGAAGPLPTLGPLTCKGERQ
jgi:outer membrane usher protein